MKANYLLYNELTEFVLLGKVFLYGGTLKLWINW